MPSDHPITITPLKGRVIVNWRGQTIVDTTRALELNEHVYPPVIYAPREDAKMRLLEPSTRKTTCPYNGLANYFSLSDNGLRAENAVWTYENPKAEAAAIASHLAFHADRVSIVRRDV